MLNQQKPGFILTQKQQEAKNIIRSHKYTLLAGGSRSGKTAFLVYSMVMRALHTKCRQAILRFHFNDVKRSIGQDTLPKIIQLIGVKVNVNKSDWIYTFDNGSEIYIGGLDDKDRVEKILGNEYSTIYLNEASQISYHAYTTALTRLAENSGLNNKVFIDCNPPEQTHWLYDLFILNRQPGTKMDLLNPDQYGYMQMNPQDNPHLPKGYIEDVLESLPDRQRRRFLLGEWLEKRQGALVNAEDIERNRVTKAPPTLPHIVIGLDPAVTAGEESDQTGIVTVGRDLTGEYYILSDDTMKGTPAEWAAKINGIYDEYQADAVIAEVNNGGDLIEHVLHTVNPRIPCYTVRATRGKILRAEPIAALYAQGKIHHVGYGFPELEDQLTSYTGEETSYSPDAMDAEVWAITYLMSIPTKNRLNITSIPRNEGIGRSSGFRMPPSFYSGGRPRF